MTLFDLEPLTPAEVIRHKGRHPITLLELDPDETRTCGNCANRRWVWDGVNWHDTACNAVSRCLRRPRRNLANEPGPDPDYFCDERCCTSAEACSDGDDWKWALTHGYRTWPWAETVQPWMPACSRFMDLEAEQVIAALT